MIASALKKSANASTDSMVATVAVWPWLGIRPSAATSNTTIATPGSHGSAGPAARLRRSQRMSSRKTSAAPSRRISSGRR